MLLLREKLRSLQGPYNFALGTVLVPLTVA